MIQYGFHMEFYIMAVIKCNIFYIKMQHIESIKAKNVKTCNDLIANISLIELINEIIPNLY